MDHSFCRAFLKSVMMDVRKHTTAQQRKDAWTADVSGGHTQIEFHGPDGFYWYQGSCCKYDARANGWLAWMESEGIEIDEPNEDEPASHSSYKEGAA